MDIAVLSDIHGNYVAFKECVEYALSRNINTFIFLGDYLGELPYPQKTMKMIFDMDKKYNCYMIRGNKENYWINYLASGEKGWEFGNSTTGSLFYTYNNLTVDDLEFFKQLPICREVSFNGYTPIQICHGSPNKVNEKILPNTENTNAIFEHSKYKYILCGHTHIQRTIGYKGKKAFNPGSVGVPLRSGGKAQFMILHGIGNEWTEEFISLNYDVDKIISDLQEAGLCKAAPFWSEVTKQLLRTGKVSHATVLAKAMKYCTEDLGECNWPNIPEVYWEKAVAEMIG